MIKSELGSAIEEGSKQKMIKDICSFLQFIDINLQGDSFQSDGILEYAEKTIKSRYEYDLVSMLSVHLNVV